MKEENQGFRLCFICDKAPIKRICLDQQCINNQIYLFCDDCRKDPHLRKYASEIYEIDSFSFPFCLFSINAARKQEAQRVQIYSLNCRQSMRQNLTKIYDSLQEVESKILQSIIELSETFSSERVEEIEYLFKNQSSQNSKFQLIKKINTLKWFRENKDLIENPTFLSEKIHSFSLRFQERFCQLANQIQSQMKELCDQFSINNFFNEHPKQSQKQIQRSKNQANRSKNIKVNKQNNKVSDIKSHYQILNNAQNHQLSEPSANLKQKNLQFIIESEHSKEQQKLQQQNLKPTKSGKQLLFEIAVNNNEERQQIIRKPSENRNNKKKLKQNQEVKKPICEQQNKTLPLVLTKVARKQDYDQSEKLIINLGNIVQIIWGLHEGRIYEVRDKLKQQFQNQQQKIQQEVQSVYFQIDSKKLRIIELQKIKYLQVQQLPNRQKQVFTVLVDGKQTKIVYSWLNFKQCIEKMSNLQQLHIFTVSMFLTQEQFLSILILCSNLTVVSVNCLNPVFLILERYKQLISGLVNQKMNILQFSGNIPFFENIECYDLKMYYPEDEKNKKIYDQNFVHQSQNWINKQLQRKGEKLYQRQTLPHQHSCWFFKHDRSLLQKERFQNKITVQQNLNISQCFLQLRNCWIPNLCKDQLKQIQKSRKLEKIQHLTLGFHQIKLQTIPSEFYSGCEGFLKLLKNLKSLNLVNLNIYELSMKLLFNTKIFKHLESLKVEFCLGLNNEFYSNLPKNCPKLRKIAVNNIGEQTDGDFIFNLSELETIILPWSQIKYKGLSYQLQQQNVENQSVSNNNLEINFIEGESLSEKIHYKKWKYINVYGCSWFHTDFFALIDLVTIQHLNIGKCSYVDIHQLIDYLKSCENLQSLCIDELPIQNEHLFEVLIHLPKLQKLSIAHCPNLDFRAGKLSSSEVQILDQMTHLDLRNQLTSIDSCYTLQMKKPKYLLLSRAFDIEPNQLLILTQRQIYASCAKY